MNNLIKALQIFLKYGDPQFPTHCEHDVLSVAISPEDVSEEDTAKLFLLGFVPGDEHDNFISYRFGSY